MAATDEANQNVSNYFAHPLLLDVVLNKVFETLEVEVLLKCRLVCKAWMRNSTLKSNIKKKSIIYLRCIFLHTSTTRENISKFFQLSGPIYEYYHFASISYHNHLIYRFFELIGPTIKILKLQLDLNQLNIDQFRELIYERVPNLTELNIYSLSHEEVFLRKLFPPTRPLPDLEQPTHANLRRLEVQEVRTPISKFMIQFMGTLPNLREIILKVDVCSDWSVQADLWRQNSPLATSIIKGLQKSGAFTTVKTFKCGKLRPKHIESLYDMGISGLQLEMLEVHMPPKNAEDIFNSFIDTQRNSLKQLIIFEHRSARYSQRSKQNEQDRVFSLRLPELMSKLEVLQLSKYPKSVIVPVSPVDYTRQCPRLKKLVFLGYSDKNDCGSLYIPSVKSSSLNEIILWNRVHDPNIAYILGNSFSLTKLTVRFPSQEFLKALWSACDKLENLCLFLEEGCYMDEGITGLPTSIISRWMESSKAVDGVKNEVLDWMEYTENQEAKSIRNLKNLQSLKIVVDHDDTCDKQALCDASAYFALKEMTHLRYLELFSSHWHIGLTNCQFFSQEYCHLLKMHLDLTVIHFSPYEET